MKNHEIQFINRINNAKADIRNAMLYIKEAYGVDSTYDEAAGIVRMTCENVTDSLKIATAKEYVENYVGEDMIKVIV